MKIINKRWCPLLCRVAVLVVAFAVAFALNGCASDAYYNALTAQAAADRAESDADKVAADKWEASPLVDFSWVDEYGIEHKMIVNRPHMGYGTQSRQRPRRTVPAPWAPAYKFFDRVLGTGERLFPFLISRNDGDQSASASYEFGDNAFFVNSGDGSPNDVRRDTSTAITGQDHMGY